MSWDPPRTESFDAVIVGSGLAGLQCARLLGHYGYRVLLSDRKPAPGAPVHTTGIFVRKTLEDFGLPGTCLGPPVRRVVLHAPSGRRVEFESPHEEFRLGRMKPLYDRFLADAVAAGVEFAPSHRFVTATPGPDGPVVGFESPGGGRAVRARFLIGADGVRSPVARALGLSENREWIVGIEDVFPLDPDATDENVAPAFHCYLDPSVAPGYIAWAIPDRTTGLHVGVGGYPGRFHPARALDRFADRVAGEFPITRSVPPERRAGRIPVGGVLPRLADASGLLVGDAAGAASPLTAGGLDACLRLSAFAAVITDQFLRSGRRDLSVLGGYSGRRLSRRLISRRLMRRAFALLGRRGSIELAFSLLRTKPCRALGHHVFFGRGSFPEPTSEFAHLSRSLRSLRV
jgi:flavin-dependent dehydrogenase